VLNEDIGWLHLLGRVQFFSSLALCFYGHGILEFAGGGVYGSVGLGSVGIEESDSHCIRPYVQEILRFDIGEQRMEKQLSCWHTRYLVD